MTTQEQKLDNFIPNAETIQGVKRQLINAGIDPEHIPHDWMVATIAAMTKWQTQTTDGLQWCVRTLGFSWNYAKDNYEYRYLASDGNKYLVPNDRIHFFAGAALFGKAVSPSIITATRKENRTCEGCGGSMHCTKDVRDPNNDRMETLCNGCLSLHDNYSLRDKADKELCYTCPVEECHNNKKSTRLLA